MQRDPATEKERDAGSSTNGEGESFGGRRSRETESVRRVSGRENGKGRRLRNSRSLRIETRRRKGKD